MDNYITHIEIEGLVGERDIYFSPDPKVNILAGINGSGKSTVLRILFKYLNLYLGVNPHFKKNHEYSISGQFQKYLAPLKNEKADFLKLKFNREGLCRVELLSTFDLLLKIDEKENNQKTQLDLILNKLIYGNINNDSCYIKVEAKFLKQATTFYRKGRNEKGDLVLEPIDNLFETINSFLVDSNKKIVSVDDSERRLKIVNQQNEIIEFKHLSTGEKQMLIIMFTVFLQEKETTIFLLDEPEITLHIKWQENLIDAIFKINPNIQLFIATHASSIFFNGYQDKLVLMEDISSPMKLKEKI